MKVNVPWYDGTTREVEEHTPVVLQSGHVVFVRNGGYVLRTGESVAMEIRWGQDKVSGVLTSATEPPVAVNVPDKIGAVIAQGIYGHTSLCEEDGALRVFPFMLTSIGWVDRDNDRVLDNTVVRALRDGAVVAYESTYHG